MNIIDKLQSVLVLLAVALGLALGQFGAVGERAGAFVIPFLMLMLTGVFLHVPIRDLGAAFRQRRFTGWSLGVNFVWTPVFGWFLGWAFLSGQADLRVGLLMLLVTPCTDWYLVFTQLARGNVPLAASLLPWHLILQLLLLPVYLYVFAGALVPIELSVLLESVLLVLGVPLAAALALRMLALRTKGQAWLEGRLLPSVMRAQLAFLLLAITAMFASQGGALIGRPDVLWRLLPAVLVFFAVNLGLGIILARVARFDYATCVGFCFATLARNSPVSLAIAVAAFPDRPLIALTLVVGPLIELPVLALVTQLFRPLRQLRWEPDQVR